MVNRCIATCYVTLLNKIHKKDLPSNEKNQEFVIAAPTTLQESLDNGSGGYDKNDSFAILNVVEAHSDSDDYGKMADPSMLNFPREKLSVVFVENPSALHDAKNGYDDLTSMSVADTPACHKMKQHFPNIVHETENGWDIYDWVSSRSVVIFGIWLISSLAAPPPLCHGKTNGRISVGCQLCHMERILQCNHQL